MTCPYCGSPSERGQLVCVECGNRLALKEERRERRFDNTPAVVVLLAVVMLGAGAAGFALSELTDDSGGDSSAAGQSSGPSPSAGAGSPQTETETETGESQPPSRSLLLEWPKDLTGYTVVLVTSGDRPAARRVAVEAAKTGLEAGLLRSDDYDLGTNLWIVFAGRFDNQESADR